MKKVINESIIRQIVSETLTSMILEGKLDFPYTSTVKKNRKIKRK
jgi:hypothetical protein